MIGIQLCGWKLRPWSKFTNSNLVCKSCASFLFGELTCNCCDMRVKTGCHLNRSILTSSYNVKASLQLQDLGSPCHLSWLLTFLDLSLRTFTVIATCQVGQHCFEFQSDACVCWTEAVVQLWSIPFDRRQVGIRLVLTNLTLNHPCRCGTKSSTNLLRSSRWLGNQANLRPVIADRDLPHMRLGTTFRRGVSKRISKLLQRKKW